MSISFINKGKGNSDSLKPNIFVQETEPEIKDGIWFQTNNTFRKIQILDNYNETPEWLEPTLLSENYIKNLKSILEYKGEILFVIKETSSTSLCKYDINNNILSNWKTLNFSSYYFVLGILNEELYTYDSSKLYKYNLITDIVSEVYSFDSSIVRCCIVNNLIYLFLQNRKIYICNTESATVTDSGKTVPENMFRFFNEGSCFYIDNCIYLIGNNNTSNSRESCKYDIKNLTFTKLADVPYNCYSAGMCIKNKEIYIFGNSDENNYNFYIYDIATDTYFQQENLLHSVCYGICAYIQNNLYVCSSGSIAQNNYLQVLSFPVNLSYADDSLIIIKGANYKTKLIKFNGKVINGNIDFNFKDTKYYGVENGLDETIPTYYGNGTEWIKFKN